MAILQDQEPIGEAGAGQIIGEMTLLGLIYIYIYIHIYMYIS